MNTPQWLHERNNDPYGTPPNHPFWNEVQVEQGNGWKLFERGGVWYGYDVRHNGWYRFKNYDEGKRRVQDPPLDPWV